METATDIRLPALHRYPDHSQRSGVVAYAARREPLADVPADVTAQAVARGRQ